MLMPGVQGVAPGHDNSAVARRPRSRLRSVARKNKDKGGEKSKPPKKQTKSK